MEDGSLKVEVGRLKQKVRKRENEGER